MADVDVQDSLRAVQLPQDVQFGDDRHAHRDRHQLAQRRAGGAQHDQERQGPQEFPADEQAGRLGQRLGQVVRVAHQRLIALESLDARAELVEQRRGPGQAQCGGDADGPLQAADPEQPEPDRDRDPGAVKVGVERQRQQHGGPDRPPAIVRRVDLRRRGRERAQAEQGQQRVRRRVAAVPVQQRRGGRQRCRRQRRPLPDATGQRPHDRDAGDRKDQRRQPQPGLENPADRDPAAQKQRVQRLVHLLGGLPAGQHLPQRLGLDRLEEIGGFEVFERAVAQADRPPDRRGDHEDEQEDVLPFQSRQHVSERPPATRVRPPPASSSRWAQAPTKLVGPSWMAMRSS